MSRLQTPIRRNDTVVITAGKDSGKRGRVLKVLPEKNRLIVEGVNMVKRHQKLRAAAGRGGQEGGIINQEAPLHVSNVQILCPSCGPTRIGYKVVEGESKTRVCRKCGGEI